MTYLPPEPIDAETAKRLYGASWHHGMNRGDAFSRCDRFAYEPPNGVGFTAPFGGLFGYLGNDCLLFTICAPLDRAQEEPTQ